MSAVPLPEGIRSGSDENRDVVVRMPGLIAFAATLVLAATTGLPLASVADLIPRSDDRAGPFLGI